jgi:hypothetical protein
LEKLFSFLKKKGLLEAGCVYVITKGKHLIEVRILDAVLVSVKSRTLSHEQIIKALHDGDISEVNEAPSDMRTVSLEHIQSATIKGTFPTFFPIVFSPRNFSTPPVGGFLRLLKHLAAAGTDGFAAFDCIAGEIQKKYQKFSLDHAEVKKRIEGFSKEFLSADPSSRSESLPIDGRSIPGWVLDKTAVHEGLIKDAFLTFVFWGEYFQPLFKTIVKKDMGFGAAVGVARVSKLVYNTATDRTKVTFFKGDRSSGDMKISWNTEKSPEIRITPVDMNKLGLGDGETVNTIFGS